MAKGATEIAKVKRKTLFSVVITFLVGIFVTLFTLVAWNTDDDTKGEKNGKK